MAARYLRVFGASALMNAAWLAGCCHCPPVQLESSSPAVGTGECLATMFFGMASADGSGVSEQEWQTFLNTVVTPQFPDGLTVIDGNGQYLSNDGTPVIERSKIVMIVHDNSGLSRKKLFDIAGEYRTRFNQEAVMVISLPIYVR